MDRHETCGIVDNGLGLVFADLGEWDHAAVAHTSAAAMQPSNAGWHSQKLHAEAMAKRHPSTAKTTPSAAATAPDKKRGAPPPSANPATAHPTDEEGKQVARRVQLYAAVTALSERITTTRPPACASCCFGFGRLGARTPLLP